MASDSDPSSANRWRLAPFQRGDTHREAAARLRDWTRTRFLLNEGETITANEIACDLPGCPPLETVIAFWTEDGTKRHHYKIFKPITEVTEDDLPPGWMKPALEVSEDFYCSCC